MSLFIVYFFKGAFACINNLLVLCWRIRHILKKLTNLKQIAWESSQSFTFEICE